MMRNLTGFFAFLLALLLFSVDPVVAQSGVGTSRTTLRQQDRKECTKQATQQNIEKRNQGAFVLKCEADRQASRNEATKKKLLEEFAVQQKLLEKQTAKQADCKQQAREHKLHFRRRLHFIKRCMAG
jgi:hypothetical protein